MEPVAYRLDILDGLIRIHSVFHILQLKKYNPDSKHVLNEEPQQLQPNLSYVEKLVKIIERSVKELRNKKIPTVKIFWERHGTQDATWETEEWVEEKYPELLQDMSLKFRDEISYKRGGYNALPITVR
jgi:hypothetical protein